MTGSTESFDEIPGGYFCFSDEGIVQAINRPLLEQIGYEPGEVVGRPLEALLTIASRIFFQTHLFPLLKLQAKAEEIFLTLRMKNGDSLPVLLNAASTRRGESVVHQCLCLPIRQRQKYEAEILHAKHLAEQALRENSELIEAKQALERHQQQLDEQLVELQQKNQELFQFGKLVTHDLQEPLRKIALLADLLQQQEPQGLTPTADRYLGKIIQASHAIRELIRRLRDYLLLDVSPHRFSRVALKDAILKAQALVGQHRQVSDIRLVTNELPVIDADLGQLVELFRQLIDNSVQFRKQPVQSPVEIRITAQLVEHNRFRSLPGKYNYTEFVRIQYEDNGPGLETGISERVFQIHNRKNPGKDGLGFGLAICKKIVANHEGVISVDAPRPPGARFVILLPVRQSQP
ncbi:hypothetical protein GCM10028803_60970 [Larkinella knui]|nr:ATP-binding protein [Larkinella knui]